MFGTDFVNRIKYLLQRYNVPAEQIELLIPDGMSESNFNAVVTILVELQTIGFVVDVDGYLAKCSLKTLPKDLPASYIRKNPEIERMLTAMEQRRLSGPMAPEDFTHLFS